MERAASLPPGSTESLAHAGVTPREREVLVLLVGRLTNREIADRLHCSVRTVESHVSALLGKLGVADRIELATLGPSLLGGSPSATRRLPRPMTSFVGRFRELEEIDRLLASSRLVTLIGAPGIGKTRIAVEFATRRLGPGVTSGASAGVEVAFCDLTPIADDALVAEVVLAALGGSPPEDRSPIDALSEIVPGRRMLLLLDNCEHVATGAADAVRAAIGASGDLRVLATSREPLGVDGELTYLVRSLGTDDDATRLFTDRARAARPDFRPETTDLAAISEICRRLDGLPLAIELTAPLLRAYSPAQLETALDDVALLTPVGRSVRSHHDTLRTSLEWSHRLLVSDEQRLFARLSVFAGSVGLNAIEAICSDAPLARRDVIGLLASLVDRSLVEADTTPSTGSRFRLLFPIRAFARERAAASGESARLECRHAEFFAERAEEAEPNLLGPDALDWVARLRGDIDDIRAALAWSYESGEVESGLRIIAALGPFWEEYDRRREWIERAIELVSSPAETPTPARARALVMTGNLLEAWDPRAATSFAEQGLRLAESMGDAPTVAQGRVVLGTLLGRVRDRAAESREMLQRAYDWFIAAGDRHGAAGALFGIGQSEPPDAAIARWSRARELYEAVGDELRVANMLYLSGMLLIREDADLGRAQAMLSDALERSPRHGSEHEAAHARSGLGHLGVMRGDTEAHSMIEAALPVFRATGDVRCTARCESLLGVVALRSGDDQGSLRLFRAAIVDAQRVDDMTTLSRGLDGVGAALSQEDDRTALVLHGAAARIRERGQIPAHTSLLEEAVAASLGRRRSGDVVDGTWPDEGSLAPAEAARLALAGT